VEEFLTHLHTGPNWSQSQSQEWSRGQGNIVIYICGSLPWELPTGYPNRYRSNNSIKRITVVTNNSNNTRIVASDFYIWVRLKASTELYEK
jgi:hypothetical protein